MKVRLVTKILCASLITTNFLHELHELVVYRGGIFFCHELNGLHELNELDLAAGCFLPRITRIKS